MANVIFERPSTWVRYRPSMCKGCWSACCTMPVEVDAQDLITLGLASSDELTDAPKKTARRLEQEGVISSYRASTGLFTLKQRKNGDCPYLTPDRTCSVYERRPKVCRRFPEVGPRPGFCPAVQTERYRARSGNQ